MTLEISGRKLATIEYRTELSRHPEFQSMGLETIHQLYWDFVQWQKTSAKGRKRVPQPTQKRFVGWLRVQMKRDAAPTTEQVKRTEREHRLKSFVERGEVCPRCFNTGTEVIPGKGSRTCEHLPLTEEEKRERLPAWQRQPADGRSEKLRPENL